MGIPERKILIIDTSNQTKYHWKIMKFDVNLKI